MNEWRGFARFRFFGFLANRCRKQLLPLCKQTAGRPVRNHSKLNAQQISQSVEARSALCVDHPAGIQPQSPKQRISSRRTLHFEPIRRFDQRLGISTTGRAERGRRTSESLLEAIQKLDVAKLPVLALRVDVFDSREALGVAQIRC